MSEKMMEEARRHALSDIGYVDGLQAHMDEGGTVSPRNIEDLIAMVRWNAERLVALLATPEPEPEDDPGISLNMNSGYKQP